MSELRITPGAFRRRLAFAFVLALGLLTAGVHTSGYVIIRESLLQDAFERTHRQARFITQLAEERIPDEPTDAEIADLVDWLERRTRFEAVLVQEGEEHRSSSTVALVDVPADLVGGVEVEEDEGEALTSARTTLGDIPYLVFGAEVEQGIDVYLFYSQIRVWDHLTVVRRVLILSWFMVVIVAGLSASLFAKRVLHPVARAGQAARSLAEGLLDTRLPVETSDEFGAWAHSFNQMADALQAKIVALREARDRERRFTADVSHELKTPLTALTGAASMLASRIDDLPDDARRPAELLVADVRRLRDLVEDLIEISRIDAGQESVAPESFDPAEQVRSLLDERGWSETVRLVGADDGRIVTDPRRYERIVSNLIENAIEHGAAPVEVELKAEVDGLVVIVRDRGAGIPEEHLSRVFDRFYKVDPARASSGSGLGLAIARENARLLGGDIEVESADGGSSFRVRIRSGAPSLEGES